MVYPRPRPLVGDASTAAERAADPAGWRLEPADRDGLAAAIAARRDIRRFRPDPVPGEVLDRVLAAGHQAPSVGHSQPWRFLVVRDPATRARAAVLADRERLRQADALDAESARHLKSLSLEGLREAPVGVVVCCDRRARAAGVLGRATFPDADLWSCACAVQNIWLTARAEGLGLGWVTLFRPADLADLLHLPDGVQTLGWLCLGWPDERPPEPGLARQGWSRRAPLADVVLAERWPDGGPPPPVDRSGPAAAPRADRPSTDAAPPADRPSPTAARLADRSSTPAAPPATPEAPALDPAGRVGARDADDLLLAVPGALGLLGGVLTEHGRSVPATGGVLLVAAADHPVAARGVSGYPASVTRTVARAFADGRAAGAVAAAAAGLELVLVDAGIDGPAVPGWRDARPGRPRGDLVGAAALHPADAEALLATGGELGAHTAARHGLLAVGEVGIGNTTVAAALAAALTGLEPDRLVGRGAGSDTATVERKRAVVQAALDRYPGPRRPRTEPELAELLGGLGGGEVAVLSGAILAAARAGAVVVLDGFLTGVAALAVLDVDPRVRAALVAGQRSAEPGHAAVLEALGLEPLLDLRLRAGEGVGAALAVQLLRTGSRLRAETGRTG